ncbi:MAG: hypothetical protein BWY85_02060 [Firmicutes bacterium ADurb.Bin506]|nr:MAG: hypothetical protein BWY85_02060 [Firmicutes bacterium ADurb.Bin506]
MGTGLRPFTLSCTTSRRVKVVFPEHEGPATSTTAILSRAAEISSAIRAIFFSWSASTVWIRLSRCPRSIIELSEAISVTPMTLPHRSASK